MKHTTFFLLAALACVVGGRGATALPRKVVGGRGVTAMPRKVVVDRRATAMPRKVVVGRGATAMPFAKLGPAANLPYPAGHILALQICLDRRGYSVNALDGTTGRKTDVALATYCAVNGLPFPTRSQQAMAWENLFPGETNLFTTIIVTPEDRRAIVRIPRAPAEKAAMTAMGYQSLLEMYAERGRLTEATLRALNPRVRWPNPHVGTLIQIPYFPQPLKKRGTPRMLADVLRVSLERREITAFDRKGKLIALFPCSIAAEKNKRPPPGEIEVATLISDPNYTYTPDELGDQRKYIYPPGPNNPVGLAWIGLSLPTYGIHGTPWPEQIGRAESHGCFRLSNWNAVRLRELCDIGTSIVIE